MSLVPEPSMSAKRTRFGSNWSGASNRGLPVERDLAPEAAVAEVRPVADLAVADADDVDEAVAAHVGEVDGLGAVGEDDRRALQLVASACGRTRAGSKPSFARERYQTNASCSVMRTSGNPSPSRSRKRRFGSFQSMFGTIRSATNGAQSPLRRALEVAGERRRVADEVEVAVAAEVGELLRPPPSSAGDGQRAQRTRRRELAAAEVRLVEPGALRRRSGRRDALAVEVHPLLDRCRRRRRGYLRGSLGRSSAARRESTGGWRSRASSGGSVARS